MDNPSPQSRAPRLPRLKGKIRSFLRLSGFEKLWFLPACLMLGIARLLILMVSFRRLVADLGVNLGSAPMIPLLDEARETRALRIGRVVRLAARYTPWESNCFPQALISRFLLNIHDIPSALCFGVEIDAGYPRGEMRAHAWVVAGRVCVVGGYSFGHYGVVSCFVSPSALRERT